MRHPSSDRDPGDTISAANGSGVAAALPPSLRASRSAQVVAGDALYVHDSPVGCTADRIETRTILILGLAVLNATLDRNQHISSSNTRRRSDGLNACAGKAHTNVWAPSNGGAHTDRLDANPGSGDAPLAALAIQGTPLRIPATNYRDCRMGHRSRPRRDNHEA